MAPDRRDSARARRRDIFGSQALRLRFAGYLLLLVLLPVAVGGWATAKQAGDSELQKTDAALQPLLRRGLTAYAQRIGMAGSTAEKLVGDPALRRALLDRDRQRLQTLLAGYPHVVVFKGTQNLAGQYIVQAADAGAKAELGTRTLGDVIVQIPFDRPLLTDLATAARLNGRDQLVIESAGKVVTGPAPLGTPIETNLERPRDLQLGGSLYRGLGAQLSGERGIQLVVLRPKGPIQAAVNRARERIYLVAGAFLAAVALLAYALAPAIARGRLSQQQRAQAASVLSHVGDGVFLLDPDGRIRLWNPAAESITGLFAEEVVGRPITDVVPGWQTIAALIPVGSQGGEQGDRGGVKTVPLEVAGKELWLSFSGADFAEGRVYTFRDLSEERRVEELKMDFVTTVSHELRTPLSAITGAAMTLRERGDSLSEDTRRQLLSLVSDQSDRLAALVDDILVAGQLAHGNLAIADEQFDPLDLTRAVIEDTGAAVIDGHALQLAAPKRLPPVAGDAAKARQVLTNLIENAAKYSPDGGSIEVRLEPNGRYVSFAIRDEGLGISRREQERIFEKFYRVDPLMKRGIPGTGLGLYICRELVQHMNGRMAVASSPGVGSTFTFELPIAAGTDDADVSAHRRRMFA